MGKYSSATLPVAEVRVLVRKWQRSLAGCDAALSEAEAKGMEAIWLKMSGDIDRITKGLANIETSLWDAVDYTLTDEPEEDGESADK